MSGVRNKKMLEKKLSPVRDVIFVEIETKKPC